MVPKLSRKRVEALRCDYYEKKLLMKVLARKYKVARRTVYSALYGLGAYASLTPEAYEVQQGIDRLVGSYLAQADQFREEAEQIQSVNRELRAHRLSPLKPRIVVEETKAAQEETARGEVVQEFERLLLSAASSRTQRSSHTPRSRRTSQALRSGSAAKDKVRPFEVKRRDSEPGYVMIGGEKHRLLTAEEAIAQRKEYEAAWKAR